MTTFLCLSFFILILFWDRTALVAALALYVAFLAWVESVAITLAPTAHVVLCLLFLSVPLVMFLCVELFLALLIERSALYSTLSFGAKEAVSVKSFCYSICLYFLFSSGRVVDFFESITLFALQFNVTATISIVVSIINQCCFVVSAFVLLVYFFQFFLDVPLLIFKRGYPGKAILAPPYVRMFTLLFIASCLFDSFAELCLRELWPSLF